MVNDRARVRFRVRAGAKARASVSFMLGLGLWLGLGLRLMLVLGLGLGMRLHSPGVCGLCGWVNGELQEGLCQGRPSQPDTACASNPLVSPCQFMHPQETL